MDSLKISVDVGPGSGPDADSDADPAQGPQPGRERGHRHGPGPGPGHTVITVAGELDIAAKEQFFAFLSEHLAPDGCLILDLAEVTFLDSGGLWALLKAAKHATASGAELLIVTSPAVSRTLALTQTNQFLTLHHDRTSALQASASSGRDCDLPTDG